MKPVFKILLLTCGLVLLFIQCEKEDPYVKITDNNFLNALIESGIDTDGDGQISKTEAEAATVLDVTGKGISDMKGIEAFINLKELDCTGNELTQIDVSENVALELLNVEFNKLTDLDVLHNTSLKVLYAWANQLSGLDLSTHAHKRLRADLLVLLKDKAGMTYREIARMDLFADLSINSLGTLYKRCKAGRKG